MKKFKSIEQRNVSKQLLRTIATNISVFLVFIIILGVFISLILNYLFFSRTKAEVENSSLNIGRYIQSTDDNLRSPYSVPKEVKIGARIYFFVYEDINERPAAITENIITLFNTNYSHIGAGMLTTTDSNDYIHSFNETVQDMINIRNDALENEIFNIDQSNIGKHYIENIEINGSQNSFLSFVVKIDHLLNKNAGDADYVKVCMMISGELQSQAQIIKTFIYSSVIMIIIAAVASFYLAQRSVKGFMKSLELQKQFVNDASHELKTPLTIVQSNLENILARSNATVYDVSEEIASALKEVNRLNTLTEDLLSLARTDSGKIEYTYEQASIKNIFDEVTSAFSDLAIIHNKEFVANCADFDAKIDKTKIKQLLIIILDNAFKYTNKNDKISLDIIFENTEVIITLKDTGIGISDYTQKHIFERFYREEKARNRETGGNGLGLSIAKTIVDAHKGKITVDHNEPKGTVVSIRLPKN
ncbi:MAG: HAMP domain-containing sensor histidine kinase [Bacilli bacterium]